MLQRDEYVQGNWSIEYLIQDPMDMIIPVQVQTRNFSQHVQKIHRGYRIKVTCELQPTNITSPFTFDSAVLSDIFSENRLASELRRINNQNQAVRSVLSWLERVAEYNADSSEPQTWMAVLNRGSGNCVGRSELVAYLLTELSIPCQTVSGCYLKNGNAIFHRWIEISYSGEGAYFTEPGLTMDFVDPYHIVMAVSEDADPASTRLSDLGARIEVLSENRDYWISDLDPGVRTVEDGLRRLKTTTIRHTAAVIGSIITPIEGPCEAELILGKQIYKSSIDKSGDFSFPGLTTGSYLLNIYPSWTRPVSRQGTLEPKQLHNHAIKIKY